MKKIVLILMIVLNGMISFGQASEDSSPHLTFKNVPIDGTLNDYVLKMKKSGFVHLQTEAGLSMLEGDFASYKKCIVGVSTLTQKDLVNKVVVMFPEKNTWSLLSNNYFSLKELLTEKYGTPTQCVEKFETSIQPKDDNDKIYQVGFDRCKYYTIYETEKGSIQLSINHDRMRKYFVTLTYLDKINGDIIRLEALKDL